MRNRGIAKTVGLGIVALAVFSAVGYVLLLPAEGWPDESRRVTHTAGGFSVIRPKEFEQHIAFAGVGRSDDGIRFLSTSSVGDPALFNIHHITEPVREKMTADGYEPVEFQSQPAWQRLRDILKTHEHSRSVIFQRDGRWYEEYAKVPDGQPLDHGAWAAYFDSFRDFKPYGVPDLVDPAPATVPATRP